MFTTYEEALDWIHTRRGFGPKPGIRRMEWLMNKMNHPERDFPSIHIAGTNGKGSTVAYLTSLFQTAGHSVGSFTSPHIMKFNERISLNGTPISDETVRQLANDLYPLCEEISQTELGGLTEFEVVTAMMFRYFSMSQPDVVLIEVGLGGLYDSTNIVTPEVTIITTIGMDHVQILGNSLEEIAFQKAGILKKGVPAILGNIPDTAKKVIYEVAQETESGVQAYKDDFQAIDLPKKQAFHEYFNFQNSNQFIENIAISLMGHHQVDNAATALQAFLLYCDRLGLTYSKETIRKGFKETFWPVRMEIISQKPFIILDGAHNEPALSALLETIEGNFSDKKIKILFAALTTKELEKIAIWLQKIPNHEIHLTTFDFPRVASLADLKERMAIPKAIYHEDWKQALNSLKANLTDDEILLVTGSLYFLSDVRHFFMDK
ncbi:bifunctional folylpolyglutamate synthase/dihydrofolate synthase [Jeotgalibaca dankookensis]|uniref:bifunctional folylpolyglutamate synthase/dihydrofolate synthase n=1 Tax=Jeotgalibaca dankookensis TaxID=708126 RepID=UPI0007815668|nr:folylpolyglutamate synthase/dihydrofolate synthase family protein [Jeotgalibaca dankookensis]